MSILDSHQALNYFKSVRGIAISEKPNVHRYNINNAALSDLIKSNIKYDDYEALKELYFVNYSNQEIISTIIRMATNQHRISRDDIRYRLLYCDRIKLIKELIDND